MGCACGKDLGPLDRAEFDPPSMLESTFRENLCEHFVDRALGEDYEVGADSLGATGFDFVSVRTVRNKRTGEAYACKTFRFTDENTAERHTAMVALRTEVQLLSTLDHPNIIRPFSTYEASGGDEFHLIMELCSGGDLSARRYPTEHEAARVIYKVLNAILYCHSRDIVHRDIKAENILFESEEPDSEIKLIDFGMSRHFTRGEDMKEQIGTVYTVAPEVLQGTYTEKCDMWSIGVVAFIMLTGKSPFEGPTEQDTVDNLCAARYSWPRDCKASAEAREFVYHLLKVDPHRRWSASRAMIAPFMQRTFDNYETQSPMKRRPSFGLRMVKTLKRYKRAKGLKKLALMVTAYRLDASMVADLRRAFDQMDTDKSGTISKNQLRTAFRDVHRRAREVGRKPFSGDEDASGETEGGDSDEFDEDLGMTEFEFDNLFKAMDVDNKGQISYVEFLGATIEMSGSLTDDRLVEAFNRLDVDGSGHITVENLKDMTGTDSHIDVEEFVRQADIDGNGSIDLGEFLQLMRGKEAQSLEQERALLEEKIRRQEGAAADAEAGGGAEGEGLPGGADGAAGAADAEDDGITRLRRQEPL